MTHKNSVIINMAVVPAAPGTLDDIPQVEATIVISPSHEMSPKELGKLVERISKRLQSLADVPPDE